MSDSGSADVSFRLRSLVASWVAGPLWGINVVLAVLCVLQIKKIGFKGSNKFVLVMIVLQLGLCTGHMISLLVHLLRGFTTPTGITFLLDQATPDHVAEEAFSPINVQVGDWFMIWRVYAVWEKKWRLSLPFAVLNVAAFVSTVIGLSNLKQLSSMDTVFERRVAAWYLLSISLTLLIQFGGTLLIALHAWATPKVVNLHGNRSRLNPIALFCVFVDSGALYTITTFLLLGFFATKASAAASILTAIAAQTSATVPMSIVLRECYKTARATRRVRAKEDTKSTVEQSAVLPEQCHTPFTPVNLPFRPPPGAVVDQSVLVDIMKVTRKDEIPMNVVLKPLDFDVEMFGKEGEERRERTPGVYW